MEIEPQQNRNSAFEPQLIPWRRSGFKGYNEQNQCMREIPESEGGCHSIYQKAVLQVMTCIRAVPISLNTTQQVKVNANTSTADYRI